MRQLLALSLLLSLSQLRAVSAATRIGLISDFHLDTYYGTDRAFKRHSNACTSAQAGALGQFGCDAPAALINSSVKLLAELRPDHVICAGDWLRHDMALYPDDAATTYGDVATMLSNALSSKLVPAPAVALGNNDFVPDYDFDLTAPASPLLTRISSILGNVGVLSADEHATFSNAGFYSRQLRGTNLTVVVLNTMIWTFELEPRVATSADPLGQFAFLERALANATRDKRKAILVSHMPPSVNFFAAAMNPGTNVTEPSLRYFQPQYETRYLELIARFSGVVAAQVYGHTHRFQISASGPRWGGVPSITVGAVSPVYNNNPNLLIADFGDDGTLLSIQQHHLPIDSEGARAQWTSTTPMPHVFGINATAASLKDSLRDIALSLDSSAAAFETWRALYAGYVATPASCDAYCRKLAVCTTLYLAPGDVSGCLAAPLPAPPTTGAASTTAAPQGSSTAPAPSSTATGSPATPSPTAPPKHHAAAIALGLMAAVVVAGAIGVALFVRARGASQRRQADDLHIIDGGATAVNTNTGGALYASSA